MFHYFPSCNFTAQFPREAACLKDYMSRVVQAQIHGCCRVDHGAIKPGDTIVTVCMNCGIILPEMLSEIPDLIYKNVFEIMAEYGGIAWPDLKGAAVTLQHCFRSHQAPQVADGVRACLARMNAQVVEVTDEFAGDISDQSAGEGHKFCGTFFFHPAIPSNLAKGPHYYGEIFPKYYIPLSAEEERELMQKHADSYQTDMVVCYCNRCTRDLQKAGVKARHVAELLFA